MTPEERQKLLEQLEKAIPNWQAHNFRHKLAEYIRSLLNEIDTRDNRIAELSGILETLCAETKKFIEANDSRFIALAEFIGEHNRNLASVWTLINEAERTFFDGDKQNFTREELSAWFHKIRKIFFNILNPPESLSLSAMTSGQFTATNAGEATDAAIVSHDGC